MTDILCFNKSFADVVKDIDAITSNGQISDLSNFDIFRGTVLNSENKYATLEHNKWRLDGTHALIDVDKPVTGYWSDTVSGTTYESNYAGYQLGGSNTGWRYLDITFQSYHTKQDIDGITLIFRDNEDFASRFQIQLYYDTTIKKSWNILNYAGIISQSFSEFESAVTDDIDDTERDYSKGRFNKIRIYFMAANNPNRFIVLANIRLGHAIILAEDDFYDLSLLEEISLPSDVIPVNTLSFTVNAGKETIGALKKCDYIELYRNNTQFGSFYLQDIEKTAFDKYTIFCQDVIGVLEDSDFEDNLYLSTDDNIITAADIISDILRDVNVHYVIDNALINSQISIQFNSSSRREALAQVLLTLNAVCKKLRNGSLWFGRPDTNVIVKDITENLFDAYTITDNTFVSDISMSNMSFSTGDEIDTSDIKWYISEQTKDYILITVTNFSKLISSEKLLARLTFTIAFYQNIKGTSVTTERPYSVNNRIFNINNEYTSGFLLPQNFNASTNSLTIKIDAAAIARKRDIGRRYPENAIGNVGGSQNVYDAGSKIHPYLDFTAAKLVSVSMYIKAYELTIESDNNVKAVSNPYFSVDKKNIQSLSIPTIEIASLYVNGVLELDESENKIIERLMSRYYQYNKEFDGKILTGDLTCGDTVQLTLRDLGTVTGTITQLEYNLTNKLIARVKIWLYYKED